MPPITTAPSWPLWQKLFFRFFFIYIILFIQPWTWLDIIPGVSTITQFWYQFQDWAVEAGNRTLFHVRPVLVPLNGSGDTSYGWAQVWLFLFLSAAGCIFLSVADRKKRNYTNLQYWLCLFTRYYLALTAFSYGILKIFFLQMPFPNLSQLATPLGDFLPMRLSWMFMGYSAPYQFFSGLMEVLAGLFLLFRRTATFGTILAAGVFTNVMMMNLSYDIPVKIYTMHLVLLCIYLLVADHKRITAFLFMNRTAPASVIYEYKYDKRWMRVSRAVLKIAFIILAVVLPFYQSWSRYTETGNTYKPPIEQGLYDVISFAKNGDTLPPLSTDTLRWQNIVFDVNGQGSFSGTDTAFRKIYGRRYFRYEIDDAKKQLSFSGYRDTAKLAVFNYEFRDSLLYLEGSRASDSLFMILRKSGKKFQLTEKQFHWLSEYNR